MAGIVMETAGRIGAEAGLESEAIKFETEAENVWKTVLEAVEGITIQAEAKGIWFCLGDNTDCKEAKGAERISDEKKPCLALCNRKWTVDALKNIMNKFYHTFAYYIIWY